MEKKYRINTDISITYELVNGDMIELNIPIIGNIYIDQGSWDDPPESEVEVVYNGTVEELNDLISSEIDNVGQEVSIDKINQIIHDYVCENWEDVIE
jgi:hypothetical protein